MLASHTLNLSLGPPLVFLHGFLGTSADWAHVSAHLPFHCIAFDLPGHGHSPFTSDFCSALSHATQSLPPFRLIGYSMGGRLALQFANRYPKRILSLSIVSAHLGLKTKEEREERLAKDRALACEILKISVDEFLARWYDQPLFRTLVAKMDIRAMRKAQNREGLSQAMETFSLGHQPDFSKQIQGNTRLFVGEFDDAYRAHYREFPHTVIEQAGHAVHLENPAALGAALQTSFA